MLWAYLKYIPVLLQNRNYCKAIKYEILYFFLQKGKDIDHKKLCFQLLEVNRFYQLMWDGD